MSADFKFSASSRRNLAGVHPDLVLLVSRALLYSAVDFKGVEGVRSLDRQKELYEAGKSKTLKSKHITGHAIDVMAVGDLNRDGIVDHKDRGITWNREWYSEINDAFIIASGELGIGFTWGGEWTRSFPPNGDCPHFQLET